MDVGSVLCSTTASASSSRCARRVTSPLVRVGTSSGNFIHQPCRVRWPGSSRFRPPPDTLEVYGQTGAASAGAAMSGVFLDMLLVLVFILISGYFVLSEMSLVSLRDSQAKALESRGRRGSAVARLNQDPNRFLASVQVGVTLAGFFSAAFGGATLAKRLAPKLEEWGMSTGAA